MGCWDGRESWRGDAHWTGALEPYMAACAVDLALGSDAATQRGGRHWQLLLYLCVLACYQPVRLPGGTVILTELYRPPLHVSLARCSVGSLR